MNDENIMLQRTYYRVDQMLGDNLWTIFKDVRTYRTGDIGPNTEISVVRDDIDTEDYARILCRMLNGVVDDVSKNIEICGQPMVYGSDGQTKIPVFECPEQCYVY